VAIQPFRSCGGPACKYNCPHPLHPPTPGVLIPTDWPTASKTLPTGSGPPTDGYPKKKKTASDNPAGPDFSYRQLLRAKILRSANSIARAVVTSRKPREGFPGTGVAARRFSWGHFSGACGPCNPREPAPAVIARNGVGGERGPRPRIGCLGRRRPGLGLSGRPFSRRRGARLAGGGERSSLVEPPQRAATNVS